MVAIFLDGKLQPTIKAVVPIYDRVILIQLHGQSIDINVIQVYAPMAEKPHEGLELFYQQIDEALKATKSNESNTLMGVGNIVEAYRL